jgi:hypothetical protein
VTVQCGVQECKILPDLEMINGGLSSKVPEFIKSECRTSYLLITLIFSTGIINYKALKLFINKILVYPICTSSHSEGYLDLQPFPLGNQKCW